MEALTGYHEKLIELSSELVEHGWGEVTLRVEVTKDSKVKVLIKCGKQFIFFIRKNIRIDEKEVF